MNYQVLILLCACSAEAKYLGSRLRYMSGTPCKQMENTGNIMDYLSISYSGPVELAVEAFQLTHLSDIYLQADIR